MKIKDVTPPLFSCDGGSCPTVYETDRGTYLIIGSKVNFPDNLLSGKIGHDEAVVEIPAGLLRGTTLLEGKL